MIETRYYNLQNDKGGDTLGAWGTAIFSDDIACDIRDDYKELIGDGLSSGEATEVLLSQYSDIAQDDDEGTVFWLSLASIQWKCGRLLENVKMNALNIIENDLDLKKWEYDAKEMKKRKVVLLKLKEELQSPQPQPKKIRKAFKTTCEFEVKDAVSFKLLSGKYVIFKVIDLITDKGGTYPLFEICDCISEGILTVEHIDKLKPISEKLYGKLAVGAVSKKEYPKERLRVIAKNVKTNFKGNAPYTLILWREIDSSLERFYGFK